MNSIKHLFFPIKTSYKVLVIILLGIILLSGCRPKTCSEMLGEEVKGSTATVCVNYQDVDGSQNMGKSTISVDRNNGVCDFHLEFQFDGNSDWYVHEVKGDHKTSFEKIIDPDCKRPQFDDTSGIRLEAQTAYYWVMRARAYAKENLWITPDYWPDGTPGFNKNDLSVYILTGGNDSQYTNACKFAEGSNGCFRAWPDLFTGIRINLKAGSVNPELVLHEYGHYAAGFVFGHTPNGMFDSQWGWVAECYKRSFNEALAETFMHLFFHSERYDYFNSIGAIASNQPYSSIDLGTSAVWGDGSLACDLPNNIGTDYTEGMPLVQAVHESLWDPVWPDHIEANKTMVQAFSYALQKSGNSFDLELLAENMLKYINRTLGDNTAKVRINEIFYLHGFSVPYEVIDFDFEAVDDLDSEYYAENDYYHLHCTEDHMQYSHAAFFRPIIKLDRPAPTGLNMTVVIYTEYTFDDPKTGVFTVRFENGDVEPSSISLPNDENTIEFLLNQNISRMPAGSENFLNETRGFWLGCTKECKVRGNGIKSHGSDLKIYLKIDQYSGDEAISLEYPDKSESHHVICNKWKSCSISSCGTGYRCREDNLCVPDAAPDGTFCDRDGQCLNACFENECQPRHDPGEDCYNNADCETFNCNGGKCYWGNCSDTRFTCGTGYRCREDNLCVPDAAPDGTFCDRDGQCLNACFENECQPRHDPGEDCYNNADCKSRICDGGTCR